MENMQELISVIVPVYNIEDYLGECVESILKQTYTNLEILLIDDGTKDASGQICDQYAQKDSRVKAFHFENAGLSMARNRGIDQAKGKYIAFIDGDDTIHEDYLWELYNNLIKNDADISGCRFYRNVADGTLVYPEEDSSFDRIFTQEEFLIRYYNNFGVFAPAWGKLYKAEIWKDLRFYDRRILEDIAMILPTVLKTQKIVWSQKPLYFYRDRANSLINSDFDIETSLEIFRKYIEILTEKNMLKARSVAAKAICYTIKNSWETLEKEKKVQYKAEYKKALEIMYQHTANTIGQLFKYTYGSLELKLD